VDYYPDCSDVAGAKLDTEDRPCVQCRRNVAPADPGWPKCWFCGTRQPE
jgi:hypothetical protein